MNAVKRIFHRPFFIRLFNWEFWSFTAVYAWVYPVWLLLCMRARSFFFFSASNPSIKNGGFLNESKKDITPMIPPALHPKTVFFSIPANGPLVLKELSLQRMDYPLIGKPDVGGRGRGVKVLKDDQDVLEYVSGASMDFHIQEFVSQKQEVGIFYHRYPDQPTGSITGIVRKEFLSITGDGKKTMGALIMADKRAIMYLESIRRVHGARWSEILPAGEKVVLSPYGNHARGALFIDDSHLIDEALTATIDSVCRQIPEFYYGRLDIRFHDWEELKRGENFVIIEVNGAGSEATHIYDPRHSLFFAWKEIARHWIILGRISRMNHRRGHRYLSMREGMDMFREDKEWSRKLEAMAE